LPFFRKKLSEHRGYIDSCSEGEVRGWVWDRHAPMRRLGVEIHAAGKLIGAAKADLFRADLATIGIGDGRHGFKFQLPHEAFPQETIAVKVEQSQFWLIDSFARARPAVMNSPARGLALLRPALSTRAVDALDLKIAQELQQAWSDAMGRRAASRQLNRKTMWGEIVSTRHRSLLAALDSADPGRLAEALVGLQRSPEAEGLAQGDQAYRDFLAATPEGRRAAVVPFHDMLASLVQYMGLARAECAEQDFIGETLVTDQSVLVDKIEAALGHPIAFPALFDGLYGLSIGENVLHGRDIQALYAALRTIEASGRSAPRICEIGGGFGKVAHYAWLRGVRRYTIVDLPSVSAMQYFCLRRALPEARITLGSGEDQVDGEGIHLVFAPRPSERLELSADIALNCDSFPEMGDAICRDYFRRIAFWAPVLLSINQEANREIRGPGDRQSVVGGLLPELGFERRYRFRRWIRRGYVEELWRAPPSPAATPLAIDQNDHDR
jgi:hypothetical protein